MKISIRPDVCCSHARCQKICLEVFGSDNSGYVDLKISDIPSELQTSVREAVISCSEGALQIKES